MKTSNHITQRTMLHNIVSLTKKFVSIKSEPENTKALEKILELALSNLKGYTVERFEHNGIKSALVYNSKKRPRKFKILLNGHLDVIPGKDYQYSPKIKGKRLYGVGSMDMKANVACLMMAFKKVAKKIDYPLGLQLVTDEEVGGFNGTKHQIDKGVRADFVIAGEPTNFDIVNKAKGVIWAHVSAKGKTAHGAYPWRGKNAIWQIYEFLRRLKQMYPIPNREKWITTINVSTIKTSNKAFNKIPDNCTVGLDVRCIPEDEDIVSRNIRALMSKGLTLDIVVKEPTLNTPRNNTYINRLRKEGRKILRKELTVRGANGTSDARHFARAGCAGIEFGPIGGDIGGDNEWVDISSLEKYFQILKNLLLSL